MSAGSSAAPPQRRLTFGLAAILALIIGGLAALDRTLEQVESADMAGTAKRDYSAGLALLDQNRFKDAIDSLGTAHSIERDNREYELGLIEALMDAKKTAEADPLMADALQRAPNDGKTNLIAARLANEEGRTSDAVALYHRAIYGEWPDKAADHRLAVRMELIGFLREKGSRPELLAELISLEAEAPADKAMQRTLAHLLLTAGAPARAADIYRSLLDQDPKDASAEAGLGEAELEQGKYRDAHSAYLQAFYRMPQDESIRSKLGLLNTVMALDPTPRGLSAADKYQRSLRILELARASLSQCAAKTPPSAAGDQTSLMAQADEALAAKTPARVTNEMAEKVLSLAQDVWMSRVVSCGGIPPSEEALRLIMEKLSA